MYITETQRILQGLAAGAPMTWAQIVGEEIDQFKKSAAYKIADDAERYYRNRSHVQTKANRFVLRSNSKDEQPILRKLVDQKVNYTLTRPFSVDCQDKEYTAALGALFDSQFRGKIKRFGRGAPKHGIGYMQPYITENGNLGFKVFPFMQVIPLWADDEHSELDGFIRFFPQIVYVSREKTTITRAELWDKQGVRYFIREQYGNWMEDSERPGVQPHFWLNGEPQVWDAVPLLWVKYNDEELPLYYFLKELIDALNWNMSVTDDVLRDIANFIYILKNYGGTDLNEFIKNLQESLAIKVRDNGGVDKLQADLNIDAVMKFLDDLRRKIFDFGAGVDTKDPELGNASGRAIGFRYMDLDNDCQNLASELQGAFERMKLFIDAYFLMTGKGDFTGQSFTITFNMDMPVNETEVIDNISKLSGGRTVVSQRTLIDQLPFVEDVDEELDQIKKEEKEARDEYEVYREEFAIAKGRLRDGQQEE